MREQQGYPGISVFLLATSRKMVAVVPIERGDVVVGVGSVENGVLAIRQRGLCSGDRIILRPVLTAETASCDEERRAHSLGTDCVDQRLEVRPVLAFWGAQSEVCLPLIPEHPSDGVGCLGCLACPYHPRVEAAPSGPAVHR